MEALYFTFLSPITQGVGKLKTPLPKLMQRAPRVGCPFTTNETKTSGSRTATATAKQRQQQQACGYSGGVM